MSDSSQTKWTLQQEIILKTKAFLKAFWYVSVISRWSSPYYGHSICRQLERTGFFFFFFTETETYTDFLEMQGGAS